MTIPISPASPPACSPASITNTTSPATAKTALGPIEPAASAPETPIDPAEAAVQSTPEPPEQTPAVEPVAASSVQPAETRVAIPVMGVTVLGGERVYDGVVRVAPPAAADEECADATATLSPDEQANEEKALAELAAAAAAPLDRRFFLYRETYDEGLRPTTIELTPQEFDLLGGSGAYLHLDDCTVIGAQNLSPETAQGIERLLERATSRPDAGLPRADLERLVDAGHVVSCAVY